MDRKEFEKYMRPSNGLVVISVITGGMGLMLLVAGVILPALVALLPCGICAWATWVGASEFKKQLDSLEAAGQLDYVIREFAGGRQFFGDKLRLSSNYILGKRSGRILSYSQVAKIYQHIHSTNFAEDRRELRVETTDGKMIIVCKLPLHGKGDQELGLVAGLVKAMNPGVQIGYR